MNFFYYISDLLLTPPSGFLTLAVLGWMLRTAAQRDSALNRLGATMLGAGLLLLTLSFLPSTATLLKRGLEHGLAVAGSISTAQQEADQPKAIIVLAGDTVGNQREMGLLSGPQPGPLTMGRVRAAVALERQTHLPILITGGNTSEGANISEMMRRVMIDDYAVNAEKLPSDWLDRNARDTWENADNAAAILRREGITSAYLVTDAWHMRRAMIAFRHTLLHIAPAPVAFTRPYRPNLSDFLPRANALLETSYALHEWIGCAYYALRD